MEKTNVLEDAQDFVIIEQSGRDSYVYAAKPFLSAQKQFYDLSISNPDDKNVGAFYSYWEFDENRGIKGSNTYLALRFDKLALRPNDLWIPGLLEAKILDSHGKLEDRVYRDYGIIIYNDDRPNRQVAETLVPQAEKLRLELPLIVPFRALDYSNDNQNKIWGIKLTLLNSGTGIIQGKKAQNKIKSLDYKGNSGVQGLRHGRLCSWLANWDDLDLSGVEGRIDWVCGEATREILEKEHLKLSERKYGEKIRKLEEKQKEDYANFIVSLRG